MTKKDYVIQECLDDNFKEYFIILTVSGPYDYILVSPKHFDTLEEAKKSSQVAQET